MSSAGGPSHASLGLQRTTRPGPRRSAERQVRDFAIAAARLANDLHCLDLVIFDIRGLSDVTDYVLIGTGTSDRQIQSVAQDIEGLGRDRGLKRLGQESDQRTSWVVLDFVDVVVHLFEPATRAHYDLEMLWGDAPRVPWRPRKPRTKTPEAE